MKIKENLITLEFDDGEEVECEIMGVFEANKKEYMALIPHDESEDVYIYRYEESGDEEFTLVNIEDESEFEAAAAEFDRITEEKSAHAAHRALAKIGEAIVQGIQSGLEKTEREENEKH